MTPDFDKFRALVLEDSVLQRRLLQETKLEGFVELLVSLARERGFDFAAAEVCTAIQQARKSWQERWIQ
jgi:hypothetical protein